jgi:hypothetical protein
VSLLRAHIGGEGFSLCQLRFEPGINATSILGSTYVNYLDGPQNGIYDRPDIFRESEVLVSGEGARFMQVDFRIQIYKYSGNYKFEVPAGFIWVNDTEMKRIVSSSKLTSVELRYCLSLV